MIAFWIAKWAGENYSSIIVATAAAIIAGLISFYPLRNKRKTFWNVIITVWFLGLAYDGFMIVAGCAFNITSDVGKSLVTGAVFAAITAITPYIVIKVLKTKTAKWIYSLIVVIIMGCRIPLVQALYG